MHTFARAISRHRCHRGGSQEPEEQPASKHSPSRLLAPFQGSSLLTPALQIHNTQQE